MPLLSKEQIFTRHAKTCLRVKQTRALTLGVILFVLLLTYFFSHDDMQQVLVVASLIGCAALFLSIILDLDDYYFAPESAWMPESQCDELATLCENFPGLITYRDRVRALERPFSLDEFEGMRFWANSRHAMYPKHRADYARLYGREYPTSA
ncbi:hypothetical protein G3A43_08330 [Paraburkholderia aspalathi]|nr:hypothetical protein [Paraburkholderia aspalathi]MBK3780263.1 hypothetical protein [Paraburkholderia aspalathi]